MLKNLNVDDASEFYHSLIEWRVKQQAGQATYVEIGCGTGWFTARVAKVARRAIGVDVVKHDDWTVLTAELENLEFLKLASDEYFGLANNLADVIFIDGLHEAQQVKRDIANALEMLEHEGLIVVRGTLAVGEDTHKAIAWARKWQDIQVFTFPVRDGVTLISPKHVFA